MDESIRGARQSVESMATDKGVRLLELASRKPSGPAVLSDRINRPEHMDASAPIRT